MNGIKSELESKPVLNNSATMDSVANGQDDPAVRLSPSSPFVTMRHYISEFDPVSKL
jgi:hypothetical protein